MKDKHPIFGRPYYWSCLWHTVSIQYNTIQYSFNRKL